MRLSGILGLTYLCFVSLITSGQAIKKHFIPVADSKLYVEESGQGPSLLLLHGGLLDHRMWQPQVSELNKHFRVLNCDMRKHGFTLDGDSTFLNATALALILDSLRVGKAHVMGLSLGAVAALDLALAHPQRIDKLILAAPGLIGYDLLWWPTNASRMPPNNGAIRWPTPSISCALGPMAPIDHRPLLMPSSGLGSKAW